MGFVANASRVASLAAFLGATLAVGAQADAANSKCAAIVAHTASRLGYALVETNTKFDVKADEIVVVDPDPKSKTKRVPGLLEVTRVFSGSGASFTQKVSFETQNGQYRKLVMLTDDRKVVATFTPQCELDQIIENDSVVEYDKVLCQKIAEKLNPGFGLEGFSQDDIMACTRFGSQIAEAMQNRNGELQQSSNQKLSITGSNVHYFSRPLWAAIQCARQRANEDRFKGRFTRAKEYSIEWFKNGFRPFLPPETSKTNGTSVSQ